MNKVFTTGQVAKICKVSPRTVCKWFDAGRLHGYRIPGGQDRRILRGELIRFLKAHGMPLGELDDECSYGILIVGAEPRFVDGLCELLSDDDRLRCVAVETSFDAGIQVESCHPHTIVVDLAMGRCESMQMVQSLRRKSEFAAVPIMALANEDEATPESLTHHSFVEVFQKPFDLQLLAERIRTLVVMGRDNVKGGSRGSRVRMPPDIAVPPTPANRM